MSHDSTNIVIADDDPVVRNAYKAALERRGFRVLVAEDGAAAIELVKSNTVDIVLLDILMPCKEGLETLIELKHLFPKITVFAMSGGSNRNNADFLSIAKKFGADAILRKPFPPQDLFDLIDNQRSNVQRSASG